MAVFGVLVAHEDDALRACRAAVEMQAQLDELNPELEQMYAPVPTRMGLNTGEAGGGDGT